MCAWRAVASLQVFECAKIPSECLIVSLVYMERLTATTGCPFLVTSWRPILLASLILAQKVCAHGHARRHARARRHAPCILSRACPRPRERAPPPPSQVWDDRALHNSDFSLFCPMFTLKEINFLEKKFLELIDFDVSITASLYASYYFQLRTLCQRVDRDFTLGPMDVEAAAKLEVRPSLALASASKPGALSPDVAPDGRRAPPTHPHARPPPQPARPATLTRPLTLALSPTPTQARGMATTAKLRTESAHRRNQSANAIHVPSSNSNSNFLAKLFS